MRLRPTVPAACAALALLAASGGGHALAAETPRPAAGEATSAVTLLQLATAGHVLTAGGLRLVTDTASGSPVARVVVTPLVADGVAHGEQTVEAGEDRQVGPVTSASVVPALEGVAELTGPVLTVGAAVADGAASTTAAADGFGSLSVLGLPVRADGVLRTASAVGASAAQSTKTLELRDVALPSIADLLAALGLDLSKLPVEVLDELVTELDLVSPAVAAAQKALADARADLEVQRVAAQAEVDRQRAAVSAATQELADKTAALASLQQAVLGSEAAKKAAADGVAAAGATLAARQQAAAQTQAAADAAAAEVDRLAALPLVGAGVKAAAASTLTAARAADAEADALVAQAQAAADKAAADAAAAETSAELSAAALEAAKAAVALAQAALDAANRLLDAALAVLDALLAALLPQVQALLAALTAVLDGTPLVRLDGVDVRTESVVTSAAPGGQRAGVEGGEVQGLHVLGTDVLDDVLGSSTLDVTALTGDTLARVTGAVDALTGTLSEVLSTVPGLPALKVPAPEVELLSTDAGTGVADGFGTATTSVTGLRVTIPAITLPVEVALPDALSLPGVSLLPTAALPVDTRALAAAGEVLTSTRTTLGFGTLTEAARFRPALTGAPSAGDTPLDGGAGDPGDAPTATPVSLPRTGGSQGLAVLALVLVAGAVVVRRRSLAGQG